MKYIILFLLAISTFSGYAFLPKIKSYGSKDFNSNPVCYDITRDSISGKMYFATEYNLIEYDGTNWNTLDIASAVFACKFADDGKLYVGGENEIGFFEKQQGKFIYKSISKNKLKHFGRVKKIIIWGNDIIFQTTDVVIQFNSSTHLTSIQPLKSYQKKSDKDLPIPLLASLTGKDLSAVCKLKNGSYAVGTNKDGIYIFNTSLELKYHLLSKDGLISNAVTKLYEDQSGDLWVASHKGASVIKLGQPLTYLEENQGVDGMGYCNLIVGNQIYLGTSNGLFVTKLPLNRAGKATHIPNITTKVHSLYLDGNTIICCTESGIFIKKAGGDFEKLKGFQGIAWTIIPSGQKNILFIGGIDGIYTLHKTATGIYQQGGKLGGFNISSRHMLLIQGKLWVLHGMQGIYILSLSKDITKIASYKHLNQTMKVAPNFFHDLCKLGNNYFVASYGGVYEIKNEKLIRSNKFGQIKDKIHRLRAVNDSIAFYKKHQKPVLINYQNGVFTPLKDLSDIPVRLAGSAENVGKIDDTYLIGTEEGFMLYDIKEVPGKVFAPIINKVQMLSHPDSNIRSLNQPFSLLSNQNNIGFQYSLPDYGGVNNQEFETNLSREGEAPIVALITAPFKEYTNLEPGKYTFSVRSWRNNHWLTSDKIHFEVSAPWYLTTQAYYSYAVLFCLMVWLTWRLFRLRLKMLEQKLLHEKEEEVKQVQLLREKDILQQELDRKQDELAFIAINYVQKKESLGNIRDKVNELLGTSPTTDNVVMKVTLLMDELIEEENVGNWQDFQMHYDKANNNFFAKLKAFDADIDESNLLLCSYIVLNKNNQEIGDLLFLAKESIAKRKYRLKKKWNLDDKVDLKTFLKTL